MSCFHLNTQCFLLQRSLYEKDFKIMHTSDAGIDPISETVAMDADIKFAKQTPTHLSTREELRHVIDEALGNKCILALVLFDLSAAFDVTHHENLQRHLQSPPGLFSSVHILDTVLPQRQLSIYSGRDKHVKR